MRSIHLNTEQLSEVSGGFTIRFLAESRDLCLFHNVQTDLASCPIGTGGSFPGGKTARI
jgi:hypothetical protein